MKLAHPDRTVVVGCGDGCYSLSGFELMTAVEHDLPVDLGHLQRRRVQADQALPARDLPRRPGWSSSTNPDFAAYARACGADGYTVETLEEFERAFDAALASKRPTVIDAKITRWALPHYSPSPEGTIAGILELIEARFRGGS